MSILTTEIEYFAPVQVDDTTSNGGRLSATKLLKGGVENTFDHVPESERESGSTKYRKIFVKNSNPNGDTLLSSKLWMDKITEGDDFIVMYPGTSTDVQGDSSVTSPSKLYGTSVLVSDVISGATSLVANVEDPSIVSIIESGDTLRISDKINPSSSFGNREFVTVTGPVSVSGVELTIPITPLQNNYTVSGNTRVCTVLEGGDIVASATIPVVTSVGTGDFNSSNYPIITDNIGGVTDDWEIEFQDATTYTITGVSTGILLSGNTGDSYYADNLNFPGYTFFGINYLAFSGTFQNGDTINFSTVSSTVPIWERRVVPTMCNQAGNSCVLGVSGETT